MIEVLVKAGADVNARDKDKKLPLCYAVMQGNSKTCMALLRHGTYDKKVFEERSNDDDAVQDDEMTLLEYAVTKCSLDVVKELVERGADVNSKSPEKKFTPLHIAAGSARYDIEADQEEVIKFLLEKGAKASALDSDGDMPFHNAAWGEHHEAYQALLEATIACQKKFFPLHVAVQRSNSVAVRLLINGGADLSCKDQNRRTAFHLACQHADSDVAKVFIDEVQAKDGAELSMILEEKDKTGNTALHLAIQCWNTSTAEILVEKGAQVDEPNVEKNTPIHLVAEKGYSDFLQLLLKRPVKDINAGNKQQQTALHKAAESGDRDCVEQLLKKGADVSKLDSKKETPLDVAKNKGHSKIYELLEKNLSDPANIIEATEEEKEDVLESLLKTKHLVKAINEKDDKGLTALHIASKRGSVKIVMCLLRNGAKVREKDGTEEQQSPESQKENLPQKKEQSSNIEKELSHGTGKRWTSLHYASAEGKADVARALLLEDKEVIQDVDMYGNTAFHLAAKNDRYKVLDVLKRNDNNIVEKENSDGQTALHLAASEGRKKSCTMILKYSSDLLHAKDKHGMTPLHLAARDGRPTVVQLLLDKGAMVVAEKGTTDTDENSMKDKNGRTALHLAASNGHTKCCTLLLKQCNLTDEKSMTPLHLAAQNGHPDVVQLLLDKGAQTLQDENYLNYFDHAIDNGHTELVKMIISSKYWESALRSKRCKANESIDTPMRKLIRQMPKMARLVCDRCREQTEKCETHFYEFLDDTYSAEGWTPDGKSGSKVYDKDDMLQKDAKPYTKNFFIRKKNHPLNVMLECNRQELFKHPVVKSLMKSKWHWIYSALYTFSLVMYCMFLAALTGFLIEAEHPHSPNASLQAESDCTSQDLNSNTFEEIAAYFVMGLSVTNIFIEIFQFAMARESYRTYFWTNSFDWITSLTALAFVFRPEECYRKNGYRTELQWQAGAVSIFFGWINLVLYIQQMFPLLGIYVVMFTHTVITFAKFFIVAIIYTVAFGLAFYTVLHQEGSFEDVPKSLIKTWAMMIGELDFSDIFNDDMNKPAFPVLAYILFVVFVIIMSILIMNLLVGLAVGDIQAVQNTAARTRLETEIELILDVELFTPKFFLPKTVSRCKQISHATRGCCQQLKRSLSQAKRVVVPSSAYVEPPETKDELSIEERLDEMSDMIRSLMKACKIDTAEKKGI